MARGVRSGMSSLLQFLLSFAPQPRSEQMYTSLPHASWRPQSPTFVLLLRPPLALAALAAPIDMHASLGHVSSMPVAVSFETGPSAMARLPIASYRSHSSGDMGQRRRTRLA